MMPSRIVRQVSFHLLARRLKMSTCWVKMGKYSESMKRGATTIRRTMKTLKKFRGQNWLLQFWRATVPILLVANSNKIINNMPKIISSKWLLNNRAKTWKLAWVRAAKKTLISPICSIRLGTEKLKLIIVGLKRTKIVSMCLNLGT